MAVTRTVHNAYNTHYHVVFPVKYRKALLVGDIPLAINHLAQEIGERYDIEFEKLGYDNDHIHILASFPPKYGGSEVVRIFKSITAKQLFKQFPALRTELWGGEFWSDGFYFATVSERGNWHVVEQYVANQGKTKDELHQLPLFTKAEPPVIPRGSAPR
jgi:putative transposase